MDSIGRHNFYLKEHQRIRNICTHPRINLYPLYGGFGVSMYEPWIRSKEVFVAFCMELQHQEDVTYRHVVGRVFMDRPYEPGNVCITPRLEDERRWYEYLSNRFGHYIYGKNQHVDSGDVRVQDQAVPAPDGRPEGGLG